MCRGGQSRPGAPNILWWCQLILCSRQEACTAVSPKLGRHYSLLCPAPCPEILAVQRLSEDGGDSTLGK